MPVRVSISKLQLGVCAVCCVAIRGLSVGCFFQKNNSLPRARAAYRYTHPSMCQACSPGLDCGLMSVIPMTYGYALAVFKSADYSRECA